MELKLKLIEKQTRMYKSYNAECKDCSASCSFEDVLYCAVKQESTTVMIEHI